MSRENPARTIHAEEIRSINESCLATSISFAAMVTLIGRMLPNPFVTYGNSLCRDRTGRSMDAERLVSSWSRGRAAPAQDGSLRFSSVAGRSLADKFRKAYA
jgi:hypothetical protein